MKKLIGDNQPVGTMTTDELVNELDEATSSSSLFCIAVKAPMIFKLCFFKGYWTWLDLTCIGGSPTILEVPNSKANLKQFITNLFKKGYSIYLFNSLYEYLEYRNELK
jgi:hypothetical protein